MFYKKILLFVFFIQSTEKKRTQKQEQQQIHCQLLIDYLTHLKLTQSVQRNLLLLVMFKTAGNRKAKPEEFVRVYDILLQVCTCITTGLCTCTCITTGLCTCSIVHDMYTGLYCTCTTVYVHVVYIVHDYNRIWWECQYLENI